MSVSRVVVRLAVLSLVWGCDSGRDVLLGDLAANDAAIGEEGSTPDAVWDGGGASPDARLPDVDSEGGPPSTCASGEGVPMATRAFLTDAVGFGRLAAGGSMGCVYHVTNLADVGAGSLREGAERLEPLWIVFDVSGDIELTTAIALGSNKTVDGRGAAITVRNFGFILGSASVNVVIEHVTFIGNLQGSDNDAIKIVDGAHIVWIDHCSLSNYGDGLIDITRAATDVTVSWCLFSMHDYAMLIGRSADDVDDVNIRVTLHHNWWNQTGSYAPRLRFGKAHVFNNLIDRWRSAASACTMGGEIYSEANIFIAKDDKAGLATSAGSDTVRGRASTIGDWLQNGAEALPWEADLVFQPSTFYRYTAVRADATLQTAIMDGAGAR
ncbi:MAG TPA: polysaccharide lyase family 1 protein [Polyangiaceae bacterium]|nr:polysaccharide lyase family 1 protein [Polyangiaceae bacterium]